MAPIYGESRAKRKIVPAARYLRRARRPARPLDMNIGMVALRWIVTAIITMIAVGAVTPNNKDNTLPRALGVTAVVALLVTPFMWMWFLLIPAA